MSYFRWKWYKILPGIRHWYRGEVMEQLPFLERKVEIENASKNGKILPSHKEACWSFQMFQGILNQYERVLKSRGWVFQSRVFKSLKKSKGILQSRDQMLEFLLILNKFVWESRSRQWVFNSLRKWCRNEGGYRGKLHPYPRIKRTSFPRGNSKNVINCSAT